MALSAGKGTQYMVLDMSSSNLKLAVGSYNNKTGVVSIEKVGVVPLELDSINDGQIADSFGINMALKHAWAKLGINAKNCIITTEGSFMHTRDLEIPQVGANQIGDMVKFELMGQSNSKEMSVDYIVYGDAVDEETNAKKLKVRATAAPTETVVAFRDFIKDMEKNPVALDTNQNAVRKLFNGSIINGNVNVAQATILLIELSSTTTTVTILDKGFPILTRRLNITKSDSEMSVDPSEIDLWHESLADTPALQSAANAYFKSLTDAVSRTAQFAISKFHIDSISTCFLYGSGSGYKKIDKELSSQLSTQVETLNTISTVNGPRDFMLPQFVNCCGALIRND